MLAGWRRARVATRSWLALLVQAGAALLAIAATMPPLLLAEDWVTRSWHLSWPAFFRALATGSLGDLVTSPNPTRTTAPLLGFFVLGSVAAGAWTAAGLAHWRRAPALLAWALILALALSVDPVATRLAHLAGVLRADEVIPLRDWAWRLAFAAASALIAIAGVPIGRLVLRVWRSQGPVLRARARRRRRNRKALSP